MTAQLREVLVIRSLTDSDLGLFAAHRKAAKSKQRALNVNAPAAQVLLSDRLYAAGGGKLDCTVKFGDQEGRSERAFSKVHKNWRLGGNKLSGRVFAKIDAADFAVIRSVEGNDGDSPITLTFVSRTTDPAAHARLSRLVTGRLDRSVAVVVPSDPLFAEVAKLALSIPASKTPVVAGAARIQSVRQTPTNVPIEPMPRERPPERRRPRTIKEKLNSAGIVERMLRAAGDLSAPAQMDFMKTVELLASQLREVLLATGGIVHIDRDHGSFWPTVRNKPIGFVDGGLANLSSLGSVPIACRVGGYVVTPGGRGPEREQFRPVKMLISELYAARDGGVYKGSFPDSGALRDAARIAVEAAGSVALLHEAPKKEWLFQHGALVNPVSRYSDVMRHEAIVHEFPSFSPSALRVLLPQGTPIPRGRDANLIPVHLQQLQLLEDSETVVCGVIERESTTSSITRAVLSSLDDETIRPLLPLPPHEWKHWFRTSVDPGEDEDVEGLRITDSLLFRCVLEPGEALRPVVLDRNELRRAPKAWYKVIEQYPKPRVTYIQPSEWSSPIRLEFFEKDLPRFVETASLVMHCALLLPKYAFPVGLDIADKFAHIPNWMSRPVNTHTAVVALKRALQTGDEKLFDNLRRALCGTSREWLMRPSA